MSDGPPDPRSEDRPEPVLPEGYAFEEVLGEGGSGTVYRAHDEKHNRSVALKVLHGIASERSARRFLAEIEIASGLNHPHVLDVYDSGRVDGVPYFVMRWVEGDSLRARLRRQGPLPIDEALEIAVGLAKALEHAHSRDVIHRDVKPENVLLDRSGHTYLADFGIAKAVGGDAGESLTSDGVRVGTLRYMSPEQLAGGSVDRRTDIFSLGCVLYEILTGAPAFSRGYRRVVGPPPSARARRPDVPRALDATIQRSLRASPDERFDSATDLVEALQSTGITGRWRHLRFGKRRRARARFDRTGRLIAFATLAVVATVGLAWMSGVGEVIRRGGAMKRGQAALVAWDLAAADSAFSSAVAIDPQFAGAAFWLAQTRSWAGSPAVDWRREAKQAHTDSMSLSRDERRLAAPLGLMADGEHPAACAAYERLTREDPTSFAAWYGIGECNFRDRLVISLADPAPGLTRWTFRGQYGQAATAYVRAYSELARELERFRPDALLRLRSVLHTNGELLAGADSAGQPFTGRIVAVPSSSTTDSITIVAFPDDDGSDPTVGLATATQDALIVLRRAFADVAQEWADRFNDSAPAHRALAAAREMEGRPSAALAALRRAQDLAAESELPPLLATEAWLHLKLGVAGDIAAFGRAREVTDSILAVPEIGHQLDDQTLAGLAALVGRIEVGAAHAARSARPAFSDPERAAQLSEQLSFLAAAGGDPQLLDSLEAELLDEVRINVPRSGHAEAKQRGLTLATQLAYPAHQLSGYTDPDMSFARVGAAQQAWIYGERERAREELSEVAGRRRGLHPAHWSLDTVLQEARLLRLMGATDEATHVLAEAVTAIDRSQPGQLRDFPARAACVVPALALLAELSAAGGDSTAARRWRDAVYALWSGGDPTARALLERLDQPLEGATAGS